MPELLVTFIHESHPDMDFIYIEGTHYDLEEAGLYGCSFLAPKESRLNNVSGVEGNLLQKSTKMLPPLDTDSLDEMKQFISLLVGFPQSEYHQHLLGMNVIR